MLEDVKPLCDEAKGRVIEKDERKIHSLETQAKNDAMLRMYLYGKNRG